MKTRFIQFFLIFCAISLLFFPQTSIKGAKNGLLLWSATITPTLLPFLLLTGFMQYYQTFHFISHLFFPVKKLFPDLNEDFFYVCILGFFCGCPLGAKIIHDFVCQGSFTKKEGEKLLYVCNQISPMFTIGYTLTLILHGQVSILRFFFSLYFPVFCYLLSFLVLFYRSDFLHIHRSSFKIKQKISAEQVIFHSLHSIFMIGICIMVFSIAASLVQILPFPFYLKKFLCAILEITNALSHFGSMHLPLYQKTILLCMITSFGGLSAAAQTMSVYKKSRFSIWKYLLVKLLFGLSSGLLAILVFV